MRIIVEIARVAGVENRRRVSLVRREQGRRPLPDTSVRSAAELTVLLSGRESGRDGVEVGESDVRSGSVDGIRFHEDSELSLSR